MPRPLTLHPDRLFDPDPTVRGHARAIYDETRDLPLVCPHGHVDARLLADNDPFPEPAALLVTPDHYIFRMLYSQGVSLESLGIPTRDGTPVETDPRAVWQRFADHYSLFAGTPTRVWMDYVLHEVFGVREALDGETAGRVYEHVAERLAEPAYRPRALFERFNIEVLTTTDAATDTLDAHQALGETELAGRVRPCFRPDALFALAAPGWRASFERLEEVGGGEVSDYAAFVRALEERRAFFKERGATATDHGVESPFTHRLSDAEAGRLFDRARRGEATPEDQAAFEAHMLMEMARMSTEDGLVMQLHPGALRNHNAPLRDRFGADVGADIPLAAEFTRNLRALLNAYGNDPRLTLVVFTLDESTYARELAPLAGHYPAMRLGPAWWFHDSVEGMARYRQRTTETAGLYNTAGFNDDTRAFCSIPARHDVSRRVDANWLGGLVARHQVSLAEARQMARALAVGLVRETYKLGVPALTREVQHA